MRRLAPAAVLLPVLFCFSALPALSQDSGEDLLEELRVSTARLEYVLEKVQGINFPMGVDDRRQRKDLLRRSRLLMKQAATIPRGNPEGIQDLIDQLGTARDQADAFLENVTPVWQGETRKPTYTGKYRSAYAEVTKFHDVAEDAMHVRAGLSANEMEQVLSLTQDGENLVASIKETRESNHEARDKHVRALMDITKRLQELHWVGIMPRLKGYSFVPQKWSGHQWTSVSHAENGFEALRVRFVPPASAHLTVANRTQEARPLFVELEFFTAPGEPTGSALFETAELEELRPGEIREVLVPIHREHPQFWEVTKSYTVYLD